MKQTLRVYLRLTEYAIDGYAIDLAPEENEGHCWLDNASDARFLQSITVDITPADQDWIATKGLEACEDRHTAAIRVANDKYHNDKAKYLGLPSPPTPKGDCPF